MEDKISEFIDREGLELDKKHFLSILNEILDKFQKINAFKIGIQGANSIREVEKIMKELAAAQARIIKLEADMTAETQKASEAKKQKKQLTDEELKQELALSEARRKTIAETKNQIKEDAAAVGSIEQMKAALTRLTKEYDALGQQEREAASGQELKAKIASLTTELKKLEGETGRFQRNVGNYSSATKVLEKSLGEVKAKMDDFTKSGRQNTDVFKSLEKEYALLSGIVSSQANGFVSMREEIKSNQVAIEQLSVVYGEDSKVVRDLILENGKLRDSFADLQATQKAVGSDTFAFDALLQGGQALVGMYSAAEGAAALFGDNNEDLQKTMVKLQAAMALVQGVQATVNALQKEGALVQGIYAARTTAMSVATRIYSFVTSGATVAARTFNAALIATGAGAAIALIATAASAMSSFGDETDSSTQSLEAFNQELEYTNGLLQDQIDSLGFSNEVLIEKIKQRGGTEREVTDQTIAGLEKTKKAYRDYIKLLEENKDNAAFDIGDPNVKADKINKLDEEINANRKKVQSVERKITLENEKFKTKVAEEGRTKAKKDSEERLNKAKEYAEKERAAQFALVKLNIQDKINAEKQASESGFNNQTERVQARFRAFEQEMAIIDAEKNFALNAAGVTSTQRIVIEKEAANKLIELEKTVAQDIITIRNSIREQEKQKAEENKSGADEFINAETERQINSVEKIFENRLRVIENNSLREQELNVAAFSAGKITKEEYEEEKLRIENKAHRDSLLSEIEHQEELLKLMTLPPGVAADAEKKLLDLKKQLRQEDIDDQEKKKDESIEIERKKQDALKELASEIKETTFSLLTNSLEREKNAVTEQITLLEEKKAKDIEVVNQTSLNAQQKASEIAIIEARASTQKEALERKKRQLDEQRARFEKMKNIAEIIGSTASAVAEALPNVPLSILVGGIGAAQLIRAIAAPIPKFKDGHLEGTYEGLAVVDDGGKPEAIIRNGGTSVEIGSSTPRLTYLNRGDLVLPDAKDLQDIQFKMAIDKTGRLVQGYEQSKQRPDNNNVENAINRLGSRFESAIKNIPQTTIQVESPLKKWVRTPQGLTEFLNKYQ